jgi:hypothetical protein
VDLVSKALTQLTKLETDPYGLAMDSTNVYFTNSVAGGDARFVAKNTAAMTLSTQLGTTANVDAGVTAPPPTGIATDGVNVYWIADDIVFKCPAGTTNMCKRIATNQKGASFITVDATSVYWTRSLPNPLPTSPAVMKYSPK